MNRWMVRLAVALVAAFLLLAVLLPIRPFETEIWTRENPLVGAIGATSVHAGEIRLAGGRAFRPVGVVRLESVSPQGYDEAIRAMVTQGVTIVRDVGNGQATLLVEPKFYNSCGRLGYKGRPWAHWAGSYCRCPLSELLIYAGYARADPDAPGLTPLEKWRLEGVGEFDIRSSPRNISSDGTAIEYSGTERYLSEYDKTLALIWKAPPAP